MARRLEGTVKRLEKEYAAELAEVALENLLEFVDLRWYRHAAYNRGDGWDFLNMADAWNSGLPGLHKVAQYLDRCAARDEFPHPLPIVRAVLPWRHDLIRAATPPPDDDLEPDRPEINLLSPSPLRERAGVRVGDPAVTPHPDPEPTDDETLTQPSYPSLHPPSFPRKRESRGGAATTPSPVPSAVVPSAPSPLPFRAERSAAEESKAVASGARPRRRAERHGSEPRRQAFTPRTSGGAPLPATAPPRAPPRRAAPPPRRAAPPPRRADSSTRTRPEGTPSSNDRKTATAGSPSTDTA